MNKNLLIDAEQMDAVAKDAKRMAKEDIYYVLSTAMNSTDPALSDAAEALVESIAHGSIRRVKIIY